MTEQLSYARWRSLYHRLVVMAERKAIPREDAEELADDAVLTVRDHFDPARGRVETFAQTVMMNKIRNFVRDHKRPPAVPFDDEEHADPWTPEDEVTRREDIEMVRKTRARLLAALTDEEARFLLELELVLDDLDDRAVSETARRLDLTPQQGHNIRQRIERKARKIAALLGGNTGLTIRSTVKSDLKTIAPEVFEDAVRFSKLLAMPSSVPPGGFEVTRDVCRAGLALSNEGFDRLLGTLDASSRDRLLSFLS